MITKGNSYQKGHLTSRPNNQTSKEPFAKGLQPLNLDGNRDGIYYIPGSYHPQNPAALAVMLHGAGGIAEHGLSYLRPYADEHNIILLAPASRAGTWDIIAGEAFGPDVIFLDRALALLFERYSVNLSQLAIGGFSDGASYALCIGLSNGHLFTHIIAFSPGFAYTAEPQGKPAVFISHGVDDRVLPVHPCSRRLVPLLKRQGYTVGYKEFDGGHDIPAPISKSAVDWFTTGRKGEYNHMN